MILCTVRLFPLPHVDTWTRAPPPSCTTASGRGSLPDSSSLSSQHSVTRAPSTQNQTRPLISHCLVATRGQSRQSRQRRGRPPPCPSCPEGCRVAAWGSGAPRPAARSEVARLEPFRLLVWLSRRCASRSPPSLRGMVGSSQPVCPSQAHPAGAWCCGTFNRNLEAVWRLDPVDDVSLCGRLAGPVG